MVVTVIPLAMISSAESTSIIGMTETLSSSIFNLDYIEITYFASTIITESTSSSTYVANIPVFTASSSFTLSTEAASYVGSTTLRNKASVSFPSSNVIPVTPTVSSATVMRTTISLSFGEIF